MSPAQRNEMISLLSTAFGGAQDVTPADGQPLHVLLPEVELPDPWTPTQTRALTVWGNWPDERPEFAIDASVVGETGEPPRNPNPVYLLGETWNRFSFSFPWKGDDPVRVIQLWMSRFFVERT